MADHAWSGVEFRTEAVHIYRDPDDTEMSRFGAFHALVYIIPIVGVVGFILWAAYLAFTKGT